MDQRNRSGAQEARRRYQERYHEATYTHMSYCTVLAHGAYDSQAPCTCSPPRWIQQELIGDFVGFAVEALQPE